MCICVCLCAHFSRLYSTPCQAVDSPATNFRNEQRTFGSARCDLKAESTRRGSEADVRLVCVRVTDFEKVQACEGSPGKKCNSLKASCQDGDSVGIGLKKSKLSISPKAYQLPSLSHKPYM